MAMMERPQVRKAEGGRCWEHTFEKFHLKVYVPDNDLDGQTNNYGFRAPLLMVLEEEKQSMDAAVRFARESGLAGIAAGVDSSVLFISPTAEGGWDAADESLYAAVIAEVKMIQVYRDGIVENFNPRIISPSICSKPCRANTSGAPGRSPRPCAPWKSSA